MAIAHKGSISMGLVLIPVGMYKATVDNDIHFNKDNPIITVTDTANGFVGNQSLLSDLGNYDYHVFVPNERVNDISTQDIEFALWSTICLFGQELNDALYEVIYYDNTEVLYFDFGETSKLSVGFDKIQNPIFVYITLLKNSKN